MPKLYYLGKPADGFGWGVCNTNLVRELKKLCDVEVVSDTTRNRFDAPVFMPVSDLGLKPDRPIKCPRLLGYGFWEWPLKPAAAQVNAEKYHWIFAGSTWCADRVKAASKCERVSPLIQGIDLERFKPVDGKQHKAFVVFSGGKYEFRKGQDVVLAAMRVFMEQRKDAVLITSWHNPWPQTMASMNQSWLIDPREPFAGLPQDRVIQLPAVPNEGMPKVYAQCDVGLFPNRCEAGNNMVMSEFMGMGKPVIASYATGHKDVLTQEAELLLTQGSFDPAGWFNPEVSDTLVQLERAYQNREALVGVGQKCRDMISRFSWQSCAETVAKKAFE